MKIRLLADENLRRAIVLGLRRREPSASFMQAYEAGAAGKDDLTVLQIAAEQNRILVSHDLRTIPKYFRQFVMRQASPGVILIPQKLPLNMAIEQLLLIWLASEAEEWVNQIRFLPL
jgi:predicted nuclease of predicted toxin-antitoxin system